MYGCHSLHHPSSTTHIPTYIHTAVNAVLRLVCCCLLGIRASKKGLLDQASLTTLSRLIFSLFQPALLFTNVATYVLLPSTYLPIYLPTYLPIYLPTYLPTHPPTYTIHTPPPPTHQHSRYTGTQPRQSAHLARLLHSANPDWFHVW